MDRQAFLHRSQTFGFDKRESWAEEAFRVLYNVPRLYEPLALAWEDHYPGVVKSLRRLTTMGFVAYQGPVILDTRTGELAERSGRAVWRYRTTAKGKRLLEWAQEDLRLVESSFPKTQDRNVAGVLVLLEYADLEGPAALFGVSQSHLAMVSSMSERTTRWWVERLVEDGYLKKLPKKWPDVREVIPGHWRVTRLLSRQLSDVLTIFDRTPLAHELRLSRSRYLDDIDPARVGIGGATDFDHDVETQHVLAALVKSPRCVTEGRLSVEPRFFVPLQKSSRPWEFSADGNHTMFYQPDAELRERRDGSLWRCMVEYERYQTRRDGWNHIERFLGYMHTRTLPQEPGILRFVVGGPSRLKSYVELIEAFADWSVDHPEQMPKNRCQLAVAQSEDLLASRDALSPHNWFMVDIHNDSQDHKPVTHRKDESPYDDYFSKK